MVNAEMPTIAIAFTTTNPSSSRTGKYARAIPFVKKFTNAYVLILAYLTRLFNGNDLLGIAMSIQSDRWIIEQAQHGMIEPFETSQVRSGVISYGVSSYGYDMRVAREFR